MAVADNGTSQKPEAGFTDIVAGLVLAAMAILALVWLIPTYIEVGTSKFDVGPAFFPQLTAALVLVLSLVLVLIRTARYRSGTGEPTGRYAIGELAFWVALSGLTMLGITSVGFVITSGTLIAFGAVLSGYRIWWAIALLAVIFPVVVDQIAWLIFTVDMP